jgi:hypothetical protein
MAETGEALTRHWQELVEAGVLERHFDSLQGTYRTLASSWMLATFAGIGFTLVNAKNIPFDWHLAASGVALLGAIGLSLLWMLDVLVYNRLLEAIFYTGILIEEAHPELAPFRRYTVLITGHSGAILFVVVFYTVAVSVLLLISAFFGALALGGLILVVGVAVMALTAAAMWFVHASTRRHLMKLFPRDHMPPLRWTGAIWTDKPRTVIEPAPSVRATGSPGQSKP